jgi:hypothetical protein
MRKSIAKPKKKQVAKKAQKQTTKTQSQTQRQIVNVILPTRSQRVRQPKAQPQVSQFQTFYIERAPSQQISTDPFRTGVIQKSKEATVSGGALTTNVAGLSKLLPEISKEDFTKPQLTLSNISQTNIPGQPVELTTKPTIVEGQFTLGTVDFTNQKNKRKAVTPGASLGRPPGSKNKPKIKETNEM